MERTDPTLRLAHFNPNQSRIPSRRLPKATVPDHVLTVEAEALAVERFRNIARLMPYHAAVLSRVFESLMAEHLGLDDPWEVQ